MKKVQQSHVALGVIARPHGIRGELVVKLYNVHSDLLTRQPVIAVRQGERWVPFAVVRSRLNAKGGALLALETVHTREEADALRGSEVGLPRSALPVADPGEYYFVDLIGLCVRLPDGSEMGNITDIIQYPTVDCLLIRGERGTLEVPFLDPFVMEVSVDQGYLVVTNLDDLQWQKIEP